MELLTQVVNSLPVWLVAITALVTAANTITALTPTTADDKIIGTVLKVLNFLSMNFGKNKNADDA